MADFNLTQVNSLSVLLQSEYNALSTKDPDTLYIAKESSSSNKSNIYLGTKSMNNVIIINNPDTEDVNEGRLYITYDTNSVCLFTVENGEIKVISSGGSGSVTLDDFLSLTSENGVMNKIISSETLNTLPLRKWNPELQRYVEKDYKDYLGVGSIMVGKSNTFYGDYRDGVYVSKFGSELLYSTRKPLDVHYPGPGHSFIIGLGNIPDNTEEVARGSAGLNVFTRKWVFTIGNSMFESSNFRRSNAHTVSYDGAAFYSGDIFGRSTWDDESGDISSARRLAYVDEIPSPGPSITVDSSLSTTSENPVQNKVITNEVNSLDSRIDALSGHGKFLSTWNSTTGKPGTFPEAIPYTYHTGDYYIVGNVSTTTNYKPSGTSYTGATSTEEETLKVEQNDTYWFDGFVWQLQKNNVPEIAIDDHLDDTSTNPVQNRVIKTYVDSLNGQVLNVFTIASSQWESTSGISPFKYSTTITSTYDITLDTIVELFNDNPGLFSQYGFALGDIDLTTNEIQIKSVRVPDESVTLTCGFCGGAIENNPTTFESISISNSDWIDLSDSSPFKYQVTKSTTYQFSGDTLVELMNDNPLLFANNGIVIGSLGSSTVTFWCIEKPESSVSLSLSFKG